MSGKFARKSWTAALSLMMLSSCMVEEINGPAEIKVDSPDFYAVIDNAESKTYLNEECKTRWNTDDCVSIFVGNTYNQKYRFNGETGDNSGSFSCLTQPSFIAAEPVGANYSVYPYNARTLMEEDGTIKLSLPEKQAYARNSYGINANTMVAVTEGTDDLTLRYKNVCGYLKLSLFGDVKVSSIVLKGANGEKLAGQASVVAAIGDVPSITMSDEATNAITISCNEAVTLGKSQEDATAFYFVVPPTVFTEGLSICVRTSDGRVMTKTTDKKINVERNTISKMSPFEFQADASGEADVPDGNIQFKCQAVKDRLVLLFDIDGDGELSYREAADVKSIAQVFTESTMYDSSGMITTDPEKATRYDYTYNTIDIDSFTSFDEFQYFTGITKVPWGAFLRYQNLESIIIPNNVTSIGPSAFSQTGLKYISLPESLTVIDTDAFRWTKLENIILPEGLLSIGSYAFEGCQYLNAVTIHDSFIYLDQYAFGMSQSDICFSGSGVSQDGSALVNSEGTMMMFVGKPTTEYVIPQGVKDIRCTLPDEINSIVIPEGFCPRYNLFTEKVRLFKGYGATADGHSLIIDQTLVAATPYDDGSYSIPDGVIRIGSRALINTGYGADGKGVPLVIPDSIIGLKDAALSGSGYSSVVIPDSIKELGQGVCSSCQNLKECTMPAGIEEIPVAFFDYCPALSKVNNMESVKALRDNCFYECNTLLKHFIVPDSVTEIGTQSLYSTQYAILEFHSNIPPKFGSRPFGERTTVYVPDTVYERYSSGYYGLGIRVHKLTELYSDPEFKVETGSDNYGEYISIRLTSPWEADGYYEPEYNLRKVTPGSFTRYDGIAVNITHDYYIGQCEVPQWLWRAVLHYNPSKFSKEHPYWAALYDTTEDYPVESISWANAQIFISRLNQLCGLDLRLPTDAEWEFAARGGAKSKHYDYSGSNAKYEVAVTTGYTAPCGSRNANELGLYDMHGNVAEYCQDYYSWEQPTAPMTDPTGPDAGDYRVARGCDTHWSSSGNNGYGPDSRMFVLEENTGMWGAFELIGLRLAI